MSINQNRGDNKVMNDKPDDLSWWAGLINLIMEKSRFVTEHRPSKHHNRRTVFSESQERKIAQKKKRKRKIAYQSRRINQIRARGR